MRAGRRFEWSEECHRAFEDLKKYLKDIPLLTRPEEGERLFMYFGVSEAALSAVLLKKENLVDKPIYYVSKVMQGLNRDTRIPKKSHWLW